MYYKKNCKKGGWFARALHAQGFREAFGRVGGFFFGLFWLQGIRCRIEKLRYLSPQFLV